MSDHVTGPAEGQRYDYVETLFSPTGSIVTSGKEYREGQHQIALRVAEAFATQKQAMIEGPTGIGKSIAYLASAVHHAAKHRARTVIAVSTNALVDQIARDIPIVAETMGEKVTYAVMKGRSHYVCQHEDLNVRARHRKFPPQEVAQLDKLFDWIDAGNHDLSQYEERSALTKLVTISGDACKTVRERKNGCEYFADDDCQCHLYKARARAVTARIVVTNLDVLMWNYQLDSALLGAFDYVVLDEGHEIVSKLRERFTTDRSIGHIAKGAESEKRKDITDAARLLDKQVCAYASSRIPDNHHGDVFEALLYPCAEVDAIRLTAETLLTKLQQAHKEDENEILLSTIDVVEALKMEDRNRAVSILATDLRHNMAVHIRAMPVEIGGFLQTVYKQSKSTIVISATLSPDGTWDYARRQLGMPADAITYIAPTPFDFSKCALMYVPKVMPPSWRREEYNDAASQAARDLVYVAGGRTLVLCSRRDDMEVAKRAISGLDHVVYMQDEFTATTLSRKFREDPTSCLVGSKTFGTGFDVPGNALECVAIWKLPFAPHTMVDELLKIRLGEHVWRSACYVPAMLIDLKQWVGRLIRHRGDIGVIALLDQQSVRGRYLHAVRRALPYGMRETQDIADVIKFFDSARGER